MGRDENVYVRALREIPRGQTRSFLELAALAGRPGAARSAGRALRACAGSGREPWHRVVSASGRPIAERASAQMRRLRREGARPRAEESVRAWAKRRGHAYVAHYPDRLLLPASDPRADAFRPDCVEPIESRALGLARGFAPMGDESEPRPSSRTVPLPAPEPVSRSGTGPARARKMRERIRSLDVDELRSELARAGHVRLRSLVSATACARLRDDASRRERFERSVDMLPRGFGVGAYHYYREPLPEPVRTLRRALYRTLAPLAERLFQRGFPGSLERFWEQCRRAGQKRGSSILIGYGEGGINHPHRDLYGRVWFPFQALVLLSRRGADFDGGDFLLFEEAASRGASSAARHVAVPIDEGDVVVFVSRERVDPESGRRIAVRHGMSLVTRGRRYGIGVVFHLAE